MKAFAMGITKTQLLSELEKHAAADNFIQGQYFEDGKGCAVGCSLESISRVKGIDIRFGDHKLYEEHLGLPAWIARLQDRIFEGLSVEEAKLWPVRFTNAVQEGADVDLIKYEFFARLIESTYGDYDNEKHKDVKKAQLMIVDGLRNNDLEKIKEGRKAAYTAADAAYADARTGRYLQISSILVELLESQ